MSPLVKSDAKVQLLRSIPMFTKCTTHGPHPDRHAHSCARPSEGRGSVS